MLKELGIIKAHCLISPVDDTYTYNKRVNGLTIIQEQNMLRKAIEAGVPIEKLSTVLGISPQTLQGKIRLSDGIAKEVIALLSDKPVPIAIFDILRKMKLPKQIEVVSIMLNLNNFSKKFALSMLHATSPDFLKDQKKSSIEKKDIRRNLVRLEKEMASIQVETKNIEAEYAANTLRLVIVKSHIKKLLDNSSILHWLIDHNHEYLSELKKISGIDKIYG